MTFDPDAGLAAPQVTEARMRLLGRRGMAVGGGGIELLILVVYALLGGGFNGTASAGDLSYVLTQDGGARDQGQASTFLEATCQTGDDAGARQHCRIVGYVTSIQSFWTDEFAISGRSYQLAPTVFFTGQVTTGCGPASTDVGPFYCPTDATIWVDLGFLDELRTSFGGTGGSTAQAYVIAHEYGHHVRSLQGAPSSGSDTQAELQADCYAGIWGHHAAGTGVLAALTASTIAGALNAAAAVGDDRIQTEFQGQVTPESWTHGSPAQRERWFTVGYQSGDPAACDTSALL